MVVALSRENHHLLTFEVDQFSLIGNWSIINGSYILLMVFLGLFPFQTCFPRLKREQKWLVETCDLVYTEPFLNQCLTNDRQKVTHNTSYKINKINTILINN